MTPFIISLIFLACILGSTVFGLYFRKLLPKHHLNNDSKESLKIGAGLIATLAALVLGLLVASSKESFDQMKTGLVQSSARIVLLDRSLANYGADTKEIREELRRIVVSLRNHIWPESGDNEESLKQVGKNPRMEEIRDRIQRIPPHDEREGSLKQKALEICNEVMLERWLLIEGAGSPPPTLLLGVLLFWLIVLFAIFGLLAPRNITVVTILFICALSVASTVFLILEMDRPLEGLFRVSSVSIDRAIEHLGK